MKPIEKEFAEVCGKICGKVKPKGCSSTRDEFKNILIPSNCSHLKTPNLNSEIYDKLHDAATNRDKSTQRKKRAYAKATIPLMQVVVSLKGTEKKAKKELSKDIILKLRDTSPFLHQSIKMQNVLFTETQRKRKNDVCSTLGKNFRCYSSCPSTEDYLLLGPQLKKCVKILSIQWKRASSIQKTHAVQTSPTRANITKAKNTTNGPASNTAKLQQEKQQRGIQTKELKVMYHTRRLEMSSLVLLLREKANSYRAGNISNFHENWRSITSDKYILSIV